ncbi:MAG: substrate-binding domain-containing protein [Phycisphaerae bacterium]|nr:substrate-binding domain-containing protein [Phycisphaerae bacterium]
MMYARFSHIRCWLVVPLLAAVVLWASEVLAKDVLHVYGAEGPYPAMREAAEVFADHHGVQLEIVANAPDKWIDKAKTDAHLVYSGAEYMMVDFIRELDGLVDEASVTPLYWRPSAILVRPGNPKQIHDFPDLLRPGVKVMVVNGSGQTGLWEDMAGKQGNFRTVRALRNNIALFAPSSTDARRLWLAQKDIDAWLTWNIWYKADSRNSDLVSVSQDYVIYRQCSIALTRLGQAEPMAGQFIQFLTSPEAASIFAKWGWITTSTDLIPRAARSVIRIVYDAQDNDWDRHVGKALARVQDIVNDYNSMGIPRSEVNISIIFHGGAAYWMLKDAPYAAFIGRESENPNESVIHELAEWGVSIELCAQAMKQHGWKHSDILPEVKIVLGVCPRLVELERQGYVYVGP